MDRAARRSLIARRARALAPRYGWRLPQAATPVRSTVTVRRAAVAAMRSQRPAGEKPAGWRYLDDSFWQRSGERKCKECLRTSLLSEQPVHLRTCSAFVAGASLRAVTTPSAAALPLLGPAVPVRSTARLRPVPKTPKPVRYAVFLAFVRRQPCRFCARAAPSEPHHFGPRGHSQKTGDLRTLPLCISDPATGYEGHHDYYHRTSRLPGMSRAATKAWIHAAILDLHDDFFGAWISAGAPPATPEEQGYIDCLNERTGT